ADRNRSHWSTSKTPSYTKSVSWQHHRVILSKDGQRKGRVSLFDRFTTRRSWSDSFRITQFDNAGKVVVDKLTDAL
ncbi:hypothetical protein FKJ82_10170, partial [Klebsiella pneumoniae]|nr:hypothetical protein [Klebsiella pneumoniae]